MEGILVLYKDQWKRENGTTGISKADFLMGVSGVWKLGTESKGLTPAAFPVALPKLCIELFSGFGDLVMDPFGGSGTVGVASVRTGRVFILFEFNTEYCDTAMRLNILTVSCKGGL
jgi:site-specific DNA-methyltransferase (adenine-specific)